MSIAKILIIAGSDSGGGAGIQADIKTVTMLGGHAMTAITSVTAQNSRGVDAVHPVPTEMVLAQIDACLKDFGADAIKIGMIGSAFTARTVADRLKRLHVPIIVDPVMVATSGATLSDDETVDALGALMDVASLITPNIPELKRLTARNDSVQAALELVSRHNAPVLAKGGHEEEGEAVADVLYEEDNITTWQGTRIETMHNHGTGCTLASGIATFMGQGDDLHLAIAKARDYVRMALLDAPEIGRGHGPIGHAQARLDVGNDKAPRLNQVTITGNDYEKMVEFYTKIGLKQIVHSPENGYARFECGGGVTLSVQCDPDAEVVDFTAIYFELDDLDQRLKKLAAMGIPFEHGARNQPWMWREARTRDPAGNTIFFYKAGEHRRYPIWRIDRPRKR
ncbi:bifunctional hydroxymethylpyrimidine kinase/phosphomethylpyrimidine kinase [Sphingomicrobium flavum]|uniref:bifunctional hydroxymethylpyrimidine kinase/phosphomethylpyrimidine kinase n=1 Tax=Sphingomicrobium flavum TaxID=1229164 RepID=UPI0021AE0496|nr:bifunctional hydroxymethylpyrimidine kinase/phosphomethylpyrimidine kinase [Sphingomicrobium flavum]